MDSTTIAYNNSFTIKTDIHTKEEYNEIIMSNDNFNYSLLNGVDADFKVVDKDFVR